MDSVKAMETQLLSEMSDTSLGPINDYLEINAETRTIIIPSTELLFGVVRDKDVERKYFRCPRIVGDNIDLTTLGLRTPYENANQESDIYIVEDLKSSGDYVMFSWQLKKKVLAYNGNVNFAICAVKVDGDGNEDHVWNTTLATGTVLNGLHVEDLSYEEETEARDVLQQLLNLMDTEVSARTKEVQNECARQVQNVKNEGSTQIKMVEDKGAETLATIPPDYTVMTKMVDGLCRTSGPVIKQEVEGEVITINDSSDMPILGMNIYGKSEQNTVAGNQLCDTNRFPDFTAGGTTVTTNDDGTVTVTGGGATVINNRDGSLTISGEGEITSLFSARFDLTHEETMKLIRLGELKCDYGVITTPKLYIQLNNSTGTLGSMSNGYSTNNSITITQEMLDDSELFLRCSFYEVAGSTITPGTIKPMLYQDGDGTWEPYTGGMSSPSPEYPQEIKSVENPIIYINSKNRVGFDTPLALVSGGMEISSNCYIKGPFVLSYGMNATSRENIGAALFRLDYSDGTVQYVVTLKNGQFVENHKYDTDKTLICVTLLNWDSLVGTLEWVHLESGTEFTGYEQYSGQIIESSTTLRAIPVPSNGNYIDENGQQWITDYRDWERGIDVQLVNTYVVTGEENWKVSIQQPSRDGHIRYDSGTQYDQPGALITDILCTHFEYKGTNLFMGSGSWVLEGSQYLSVRIMTKHQTVEELKTMLVEKYASGNPVTIQYVLRDPIETPIPAEELLAYKALHTNYPNTTIINDSDAHMEVTYGTDTKMYIDNKFAELKAALTNNS